MSNCRFSLLRLPSSPTSSTSACHHVRRRTFRKSVARLLFAVQSPSAVGVGRMLTLASVPRSPTRCKLLDSTLDSPTPTSQSPSRSFCLRMLHPSASLCSMLPLRYVPLRTRRRQRRYKKWRLVDFVREKKVEGKGETPCTDARASALRSPVRSKHCYQNYVDYFRCVAQKGEDFVPCKQVSLVGTRRFLSPFPPPSFAPRCCCFGTLTHC